MRKYSVLALGVGAVGLAFATKYLYDKRTNNEEEIEDLDELFTEDESKTPNNSFNWENENTLKNESETQQSDRVTKIPSFLEDIDWENDGNIQEVIKDYDSGELFTPQTVDELIELEPLFKQKKSDADYRVDDELKDTHAKG